MDICRYIKFSACICIKNKTIKKKKKRNRFDNTNYICTGTRSPPDFSRVNCVYTVANVIVLCTITVCNIIYKHCVSTMNISRGFWSARTLFSPVLVIFPRTPCWGLREDRAGGNTGWRPCKVRRSLLVWTSWSGIPCTTSTRDRGLWRPHLLTLF